MNKQTYDAENWEVLQQRNQIQMDRLKSPEVPKYMACGFRK